MAPNKTTLGVKLDDLNEERLKKLSAKINRTPHWVIKQAIFHYLEEIEKGNPPEEVAINQETEIEDSIDTAFQLPFFNFAESILPQSHLRSSITAAYHRPEEEMIAMLLPSASFNNKDKLQIFNYSKNLVDKLRSQKKFSKKSGLVQDLLQEYALSSQEGIALMCMAEALLRIPDKATRDALIRDKIGHGNWKSHLGGGSVFVNAATWGLMLTGKLVATHSEKSLSTALTGILNKGGTPLIRKSVDMAMRLMGEQFVCGENISEALTNAQEMEKKGFLYSYDMLGEAALTDDDAQKYMNAYRQAIKAIGETANNRGVYQSPGISIKLSALHPRYERAQYDRVIDELYPRVLELMILAKSYDIGVNIDAEEANRLELSLDILEKLCFEPSLKDWQGIGFVIQAYQKRCSFVIDYLIDLAKRSEHRLMVRLVKGAYWDSEIKIAQIEGLEDYPVYTRKVHTDISYIACARKLLEASDYLFPQFASHNARTLASVYQLAGRKYQPGLYEFQCLHGMGESLYQYVVDDVNGIGVPCRVYAPVGTHKTLLAYLVRRLLENGANTSFVNLIADANQKAEDLVADPVEVIKEQAKISGKLGAMHDLIALPANLYGSARMNSKGLDLTNEQRLASLSATLLSTIKTPYLALPILDKISDKGECYAVINPALKNDIVGQSRYATIEEAYKALEIADQAQIIWQSVPASERAKILESVAHLIETKTEMLMGILVREAGKSFSDAISEIREAVDFLRFYAGQVKTLFHNDSHRPLGCVLCISPWNFPMAIFTGQISAALVAGNVVIAKPAEQTPIIASEIIKLFLEAGLPKGVLQLVLGEGHVIGDALVKHDHVKGIMFTGSTEVAKILAQNLAHRLSDNGKPIPLIAETGGQNAMFVDSSALSEQVVVDIIQSAFDSAGQRCSALRLLCLQEECAEHILDMLKGAIAEYRLGSPDNLNVDIGPVIDQEAMDNILKYIQNMRQQGKKVSQLYNEDLVEMDNGFYVPPTIIEIESIDELGAEVFGPVLHVLRYQRKDLSDLIAAVNATGYGLTMGVHTRINETADLVCCQGEAGNIYVNRNIIGAVVGVQPFGGDGLSGTGPKAGGPLYLYRLLNDYPQQSLMQNLQSLNPEQFDRQMAELAEKAVNTDLTNLKDKLPTVLPIGINLELTGPTGEKNLYQLLPRKEILSIASNKEDLKTQIQTIMQAQAQVIWLKNALNDSLYQALPSAIQDRITFIESLDSEVNFEHVLFHGNAEQLQIYNQQLARRKGAVLSITAMAEGESEIPYLKLFTEKSISINTAAAGGNANLMMIG